MSPLFTQVFCNAGFYLLGEKLIEVLSLKDLCSLRLTCKTVKMFIGSRKTWYQRILSKILQKRQSLQWEVDMIEKVIESKDITEMKTMVFFYQEAKDKNPLRFAAENGRPDIFQFCWKYIGNRVTTISHIPK